METAPTASNITEVGGISKSLDLSGSVIRWQPIARGSAECRPGSSTACQRLCACLTLVRAISGHQTSSRLSSEHESGWSART